MQPVKSGELRHSAPSNVKENDSNIIKDSNNLPRRSWEETEKSVKNSQPTSSLDRTSAGEDSRKKGMDGKVQTSRVTNSKPALERNIPNGLKQAASGKPRIGSDAVLQAQQQPVQQQQQQQQQQSNGSKSEHTSG